jgi:hypothetical protein
VWRVIYVREQRGIKCDYGTKIYILLKFISIYYYCNKTKTKKKAVTGGGGNRKKLMGKNFRKIGRR